MPPKKDSKKGKEKPKSQQSQLLETASKAEEPEIKVEEVKIPDYRTITITLEHYQDVAGLYAVSDISTKCTYREDLGGSDPIPITDEERIPIDYSASFQIDVNNMKELDHLISNPATLTVSQISGSFDPQLYEQLVTNEEVLQTPTKSYDSVVSIYEAITGQKVDVGSARGSSRGKKRGDGKDSDKKEKKDKAAKDKKSKKSKSSVSASSASTKGKSGKSEVSIAQTSEVYGICMIDFIPLFYGKSSFRETLLIKPTKKSLDHQMIPYKNHPKITVTVSIDQELYFKDSNILSLTVESIYNIPELMTPNQSYVICAMIPMEGSHRVPIQLTNPLYTTTTLSATNKCWPNTQAMANESNTTKYKMNPDTTNIINKVDTDIVPFLGEETPKLQFNMIKRNLLLADGMSEFAAHIKVHRRLALEMFMTTKKKSSTGSQTSIFDTKRAKNQPFLHLMVLLDLAALLYPGVSRIRLACPVRTFSYDEALKLGGLTDSYFLPTSKKEAKEGKDAGAKEAKAEKGGKKDKAASSKSSKSNKKGSKGKGSDAPDKSMKNLLPAKPEPPPEPEPSLQVYNEDKKPCFIIVELELLTPIMPKEEVEDLQDKLYDLLQAQPEGAPKVVLTQCLAKDLYKQTISEIIRDINKHYAAFVQQVMPSKQFSIASRFVKYLQKMGAYQKYVSSITKAATSLVNNKFSSDKLTNPKENLDLISDVFVQLVSEMHDAVNKLICSKLEPPQTEGIPVDEVYFYAKEAAQMGNAELANRYFMERICENQKNADYWLDYAIFQVELNNTDIAFECVQKALTADPNHKYGLLMMGALLSEKGMKENAETCLLNLMVQEQKWLEGWVTLHIFYEMIENPAGMDMSLEMAQKYADEPAPESDYISKIDDLLWSEDICPKTKFFRAACIYLKLRLFNWVEYALAHETQSNYAMVNYLLAANCYYKKLYPHALEHVKETENYYGIDCRVGSLYGHCLMALERYEEARDQFHHVLEAYNRPKNIHLVNLNCALAEETLGNDQEARKFILLSCKYNPSPYTWLRAGQLYFKQNDLLSAEECFSEANLRDNRSAEIWAHLCLVNLRLDRENEAMLCYNQVLQNNFSDKEFLALLNEELKTVLQCNE
ncbi:unnamed protein product [Callosobruchus maculatus]|uniref:Tetratricopeptide repeat protein 18 n=1 Tax=Callosobruchus maculatus TaxID=64391 RepID=A0A653DKY1_CALMS|nr:unnamed protein product [Callosobruchus maculatus]